MAGMLPGVECARRRRLHGWCDPSSVIGGSGFGSARIRLSKDTHFTPTSFLLMNQSDDENDKLGVAAREAKQRLDGRLRGHFKKQITKNRENTQERRSTTTTAPMVMENSQIQIFGNGIKRRLRWGSWKSSSKQDDDDDDGDECAICLNRFKESSEKTIPHLPCAHRFHSDCLLPWLQNNAHCPCCRATVSIL